MDSKRTVTTDDVKHSLMINNSTRVYLFYKLHNLKTALYSPFLKIEYFA